MHKLSGCPQKRRLGERLILHSHGQQHALQAAALPEHSQDLARSGEGILGF